MNNNNNQPQMSYGELPSNYSDVDDITRTQEYHQQPALPGGYQQDPMLSGYDDWEMPPLEQDISETSMPSLNNVPNNRRLS